MEKAKLDLEIRCLVKHGTFPVSIDKSSIQVICPGCDGMLDIENISKPIIAHRITTK